MSLSNPAVNPPYLAASSSQVQSLRSSRSPSRSPVRRHDPLLRDLSPTKTLHAFSDGSREQRTDVLARSIQHVSPSQRTLGTQVAQACTDLRAWTRELESWHWPGTFDVPEPARKKQRMSNMTILSRTESDDTKGDEHWGSLPAATVQAHEKRLEQICVDFDGIDFEALKAFVLAAHSQAGVGQASMDDSIGTIGAATDLKKLDDFTAVITATILQALPYLPKLTRLLETWTTRLSILRSAPRYLRDLKNARTDLNHGWAALAVSNKQTATASLTSDSLEEMKSLISAQVYSLGKRLDRYLDLLEGRPEVVPDAWIDDFEDLEQEYGEWAVRAEKKVLEDEWKTMKVQVRQTALGLAQTHEQKPHTRERSLPGEPDFDDGPAELEANEVVGGVAAIAASSAITRTIMNDQANSSRVQSTSRGTAEHAQPAVITTTITSNSTPPSSRGSPSRHRHVPIVIDYNNSGTQADSPDQGPATESAIAPPRPSLSQTRTLSRTGSHASATTSNVKQRAAAFLNGDIEKDQSLLRTKPAPIVRPFEHASNAFTRLFKRDSTDSEESRKHFHRHGDSMNKQSIEIDNNQPAASLLSGSGSSGKVSSSMSHRNSDRMQYVDMVAAPPDPRPRSRAADEKFIRRGRTEQRDTGSRMAYGDLVMAVPTRDTYAPRKGHESKGSKAAIQDRPETPRRKSGESKRSKSAGSSKGDAMKRFALELMGSPGRKSTDNPRTRRPTLSDEYRRVESSPAVPRLGRQSLDETRHRIPTQQLESRELTALPRGTFDRTLPQSYKPTGYRPPPSKEIKVPATYRPTGFDPSARLSAEQDQFPANWPLSATPSEAGGDEYFVNDSEWAPEWAQKQTQEQEGVVNSEQFEQFFVRTLPEKSAEQQYITSSEVATRDFGYDAVAARPRSAPGFRVGDSRVMPVIPPRSSSRGAVPRRPWRADFHSANLPRPISMVLEEDYIPMVPDIPPIPTSNNAAGYFGGQGAQPSPTKALEEPQAHANTSSGSEEVEEDDVVTPRAEPVLRRASAASMGSYSHDEVKAIEITRRSVDDARDEVKVTEIPIKDAVDSTPRPSTPPARDRPSGQSGGPMTFNDEMEFPSPPSSIPGRRTSVRSSTSSGLSSAAVQTAEATLLETAPRNAAMQRKRGSVPPRSSISERDVVSPIPSSAPQDKFDRHVTKVLDKVHAPIRFKSRPGAETPVSRSSIYAKKTERKSLTLAPAEASPKKASSADPEVKLYHLTQTGRSEPIKLYVRLVGEGSERVMVRVGGGWADLADYLRQYAEHHPSRTVSEGNLELQTADVTSSGGSSGKRTFSGPAVPAPEPKSRSPITPTFRTFGPNQAPTATSASLSADRSFDPPPRSSAIVEWGPTHSSKPRLWIGGDSDDEEDEYYTNPKPRPQSTTPKSASRPSTAPRPDSRSADPNTPPGLDGKTGLRPELPEQKAKWVEGMIEKAMKSASAASAGAEKVGAREREFGEIGRVGGTRRVVFKPQT